MARTQRLRRVGIILFAILVGVSIFLGNQRPAHASVATDIICLVYTDLNAFGTPIPILSTDGCEATSTPSGGGTLKIIKVVSGTSTPPSGFDIHVKLGTSEVSGSPQPGSSSGVSFIGLTPPAYHVTEESNYVDLDDFEVSYDGCPVGVAVVSEGYITVCTITNTWIDDSGGGGGGATDEDTLDKCSDTIDNDNDGDIDLEDPDCVSFIPTLAIVKNTTGGT